MMNNKGTTGTCNYCNQSRMVGCDIGDSTEERNETATLDCDCPEAQKNNKAQEQAEIAARRIDELFGAEAAEKGIAPLNNESGIQILKSIVMAISDYDMESATIQLTKRCKAKIAITKKGEIKVTRTETMQYESTE